MNDLHEVRSMLAERIESWTEQWMREGLEKGLEKGREEGRELGRRLEAQHLVLRLLQRRIGPLTPSQQTRIAALPLETLETLGEDLLDITSASQLDAWLASR
ncbi:MAG: DUF4351 domain-containing protein [Thiohalocapsa sp.]